MSASPLFRLLFGKVKNRNYHILCLKAVVVEMERLIVRLPDITKPQFIFSLLCVFGAIGALIALAAVFPFSLMWNLVFISIFSMATFHCFKPMVGVVIVIAYRKMALTIRKMALKRIFKIAAR